MTWRHARCQHPRHQFSLSGLIWAVFNVYVNSLMLLQYLWLEIHLVDDVDVIVLLLLSWIDIHVNMWGNLAPTHKHCFILFILIIVWRQAWHKLPEPILLHADSRFSWSIACKRSKCAWRCVGSILRSQEHSINVWDCPTGDNSKGEGVLVVYSLDCRVLRPWRRSCSWNS